MLLKLNLKKLLAEHGMRLTELHEKSGIRYATLSELANNKRQSIQFNHVYRIMKALNIPMSDMYKLFEEEKEKEVIL